MNIEVHVCFQISVCVFFRYIPSSEIAGSYGNSSFSVQWNLHTIFHNDSINLHFHQQYTRFPFSLHPCQYLLFSDILVRAFQTDVKFLIYIFLMTSNLSIFSCACWTSANLPWINVYSNLTSIFKLRFFFYIELYELFIYFGY